MDPDSPKYKVEKPEPSFREIFKHLFFKRFRINLVIILILLGIGVWGSFYVKDTLFPVNLECNTTICPDCPECAQCDVIECPKIKCPDRNCTEDVVAYYYRCEDGRVVNESKDCDEVPLKITSEHFSAKDGITVSIDDIKYNYSDDKGRITEITYTIINKGDKAILPKVGFKVYEKWTQEVKSLFPERTFKGDDILVKNDGVRYTKPVLIDFEGKEQTIRLELVDTIPDPDESVATVIWKFLE